MLCLPIIQVLLSVTGELPRYMYKTIVPDSLIYIPSQQKVPQFIKFFITIKQTKGNKIDSLTLHMLRILRTIDKGVNPGTPIARSNFNFPNTLLQWFQKELA